MSRLEEAKEIIKANYNYADCGIFDCHGCSGDYTITVYKGEGLTVDICYDYAYFEVYGLSDTEFLELEKYYESLREERYKKRANLRHYQVKCMYLSWEVLNGKSVEACRHPDNLSSRKLWGQCREDKCPFEEATKNE